jgi:predicted DNA-binding WGR domain protein
MQRFELSDGTASKFWEIEVHGHLLTVRFGRIGTEGQLQTKAFLSDTDAHAEFEKLIVQKTRKGYLEVDAVTASDLSKQERSESLFWTLIGESNHGAYGDVDSQIENLEVKLKQLIDANLIIFADLVSTKIAQSYRWDLWAAAFLDNDGCSDDAFMDWRAGLVLAGRKVFEAVLADPDRLANHQVEFAESLTTLANEIWSDRHPNDEMPSTFNLNEQPELEGESFPIDDDSWFLQHFPKLAKKKGIKPKSAGTGVQRVNELTLITIAARRLPNSPEHKTTVELFRVIRTRIGQLMEKWIGS